MVTKGTYAKMARGEMVRFMAENNIGDIPIAAQVVALADAYDGLTGKRDKHTSLSQEEAVAELTAGKHGAFNPLLLECLRDVEDRLAEETEGDTTPPEKRNSL